MLLFHLLVFGLEGQFIPNSLVVPQSGKTVIFGKSPKIMSWGLYNNDNLLSDAGTYRTAKLHPTTASLSRRKDESMEEGLAI